MTADEHLGDLRLDALRLADAAASASANPDPADADARAHLASCALCRARYAALVAEGEAFAARFDVAALATDALARPAEPSTTILPFRARATRWAASSAVAALAASLLLFLGPLAPEPDITRLKGEGGAVELFVIDAAGQPRAVAGPVDPHAELAVRITPERPSHVRLLWASAPDRVEALYPGEDGAAWLVREPTWLAHRIELDGTTTPERLIVIACDEPFDDARARAIVTDPGAADACRVHAIEVAKP